MYNDMGITNVNVVYEDTSVSLLTKCLYKSTKLCFFEIQKMAGVSGE